MFDQYPVTDASFEGTTDQVQQPDDVTLVARERHTGMAGLCRGDLQIRFAAEFETSAPRRRASLAEYLLLILLSLGSFVF